MPNWKQYEGELLDGKYPLERCVGADDASAVFLVGFASTAVRIQRADAAEAAKLLERWERVKLIRHPHLLEIDTAGTSVVRGEPVAYLVLEHAEENLGEILAERPLTTEETREMLAQVAGALSYLHARGLAHGDVRPANIMALGDAVKLSIETVGEGDPAADMSGLGLTLIQAMTQRPNAEADLPAPFGAIAKGCLARDGSERWTADRVIGALRAPPVRAVSVERKAKRSTLRRFALPGGIAVAAVAAVILIGVRRGDEPSRAAGARPVQSAPPAATAPQPAPATPTPAPSGVIEIRPVEKAASSRDRMVLEDGVVRRVAPKIAEKARNTIDGKPVVVVRVEVNPAGDVTGAELERSFSPYFGRLTLDAARQWKFAAADGAASREWLLRFQFSRTDTQMSARRSGK